MNIEAKRQRKDKRGSNRVEFTMPLLLLFHYFQISQILTQVTFENVNIPGAPK